MPRHKKLYVKTYGCQMNVYDSERMAEALKQVGYQMTPQAADADMILLNTCHIREKAAEKLYSELGRFKGLKAARPDLKIAVAGCVAQAEGEEIMRRQPLVDVVVGPQASHRLPGLVAAAASGKSVVDLDFPAEDKFAHLAARPKTRRAPAAFLTVQEGCDKFCAFCVVPYTRGAEFSRPLAQVLQEARALVACGVREITLLGQNVNAWHGLGDGGRRASLADVIWALHDIKGLERIRYTTSHPRDMGDDLIRAHKECPKLMPYLHLPVQSGSDRILKRMNRGHTASDYLRVIERIRAARPDILLSSDFIVGFPEETEADFQATLDLIRQVHYGQAFSFCYSMRPGTPAAERTQVDARVARDRLHRLQALLAQQHKAAQDSMIGRNVRVLFEKPGRQAGQMVGKSEHLHAVHVSDSRLAVGSMAEVKITRSGAHSLHGELPGIAPEAASS
ncbi:MAG: tRNA (N6-isopentenyl adenosine(37)-C2)-methylthiotransferase MiaB [Rhodobacteraceae bacterium]|nr:tRNA (N6-isopentenyl adenosine(37)-C2)-methylthiotransferase MiaB [Paracoccaceae bacterium]